ncbi:hypothetical protein EV652_10348 [Kribbella steppae]|uniref:Uncharacterized protein n=2 Tax=Kribbella steppae TaxID=2512223 RepID=A0A4R2HQ06_9ACTN|nr:hypothetical protein EV652_10348 [Kribbella steppae]
METAKLIEVLGKLGNIESMTWKELLAPDNILAKQYEVEKMPAHAQKRLTDINRADLTQLVRFQLSGKNRLYGFLVDHVFHVLWWDPEHQVWPSKLRHT